MCPCTTTDRSGVIPGELIPITFFIVVGLFGFSFTPIGRALAARLGGGATGDTAREVRALREEVVDLRGELDDLHRRLGDVDDLQGRLDFTERMLAQIRNKPALQGGE